MALIGTQSRRNHLSVQVLCFLENLAWVIGIVVGAVIFIATSLHLEWGTFAVVAVTMLFLLAVNLAGAFVYGLSARIKYVGRQSSEHFVM